MTLGEPFVFEAKMKSPWGYTQCVPSTFHNHIRKGKWCPMLDFLLLTVPVGTLLLYLAYYFTKNNQQVGPTEWLVMKNVLSGTIKNYGPGIHFPGPEMEVFKKFQTTVQGDTERNREVGVAGGISMLINYHFNWVIGRKIHKILKSDGTESSMSDFVLNGPTDSLEDAPICADMMEKAATKLDPTRIKDQISQGVAHAFELVFRSLTDEQLQNPEKCPPSLPTRAIPGMSFPRPVKSPEGMIRLLSEEVRILANQALLLSYGFGLTSLQISNIRYASDKLQTAAGRGRELELQAKAVRKAQTKLPGGADMDPAILALFGTPEAMAKGLKANALREVAKQIPNVHGLVRIENKTK